MDVGVNRKAFFDDSLSAMSSEDSVKLLVTTPQLSRSGGVAVLLKILRLNELSGIDYMTVQSSHNFFIKCFSLITLIPRFVLRAWRKDCILVNPSMNRNSFWRDAVLIKMSFFLKKRVVVYWHGWNDAFFESVLNDRIKKFIFHTVFLNCDHHIVLSRLFKMALLAQGASESKVHVFHNAAELVDKSKWNKNGKDCLRVLFMARIELSKGLDLVIDTIEILQKRMSVQLDVVGEGSLSQVMKQKVNDVNLKNCKFHGYLEGEEKSNLLQSAHLFFQPSSSEGMPLTILEAMFNGALIAAKPVGGIPECLSTDHSILIDSDDPNIWANTIENCWRDQSRWMESIDFNYNWACDNATPKVIREKLFKLYQE